MRNQFCRKWNCAPHWMLLRKTNSYTSYLTTFVFINKVAESWSCLWSGGVEQEVQDARHPAEGGRKHLHQLQVRLPAHRPDRGALRHHTLNIRSGPGGTVSAPCLHRCSLLLQVRTWTRCWSLTPVPAPLRDVIFFFILQGANASWTSSYLLVRDVWLPLAGHSGPHPAGRRTRRTRLQWR